MSQHHFYATTRAGRHVRVQCGWDRPLQHHHLTVWTADPAPEEPAVLYTSLGEPNAGLPDVDTVATRLKSFGIPAPEKLYEQLWLDQILNRGDGLTHW